jgi:hypothetical protein
VNNTADRRVTNLLRLLQSLDINDNPTDGIQWTVAAVDAASVRLDQDPGAFEKDVSVSTLLAKKRPGLTLVGQTTLKLILIIRVQCQQSRLVERFADVRR